MGKRKSIVAYGILGGLVAAALVVSLLASGSALAGKKNNHGRQFASVIVSPDSIASGDFVTVSGSGFAADSSVQVGVSGYIPFYAVATDSSGSFSFPYPRAVFGPCECVAEAWGLGNGGFGMLASDTFTVSGP